MEINLASAREAAREAVSQLHRLGYISSPAEIRQLEEDIAAEILRAWAADRARKMVTDQITPTLSTTVVTNLFGW